MKLKRMYGMIQDDEDRNWCSSCRQPNRVVVVLISVIVERLFADRTISAKSCLVVFPFLCVCLALVFCVVTTNKQRPLVCPIVLPCVWSNMASAGGDHAGCSTSRSIHQAAFRARSSCTQTISECSFSSDSEFIRGDIVIHSLFTCSNTRPPMCTPLEQRAT